MSAGSTPQGKYGRTLRPALTLSNSFLNPGMQKCPYPYQGKRHDGELEHHGQAKLFISEVYLLARFLQDRPGFCLYVGASPGSDRKTSHLSELSQNFPRVKWLLVDPAFSKKFTIKKLPGSKYRIYHGYFDDDAANAIAGFFRGKEFDHAVTRLLSELGLSDIEKKNFIYLNDMRGDMLSERQVLQDMIDQMNWLRIMKPFVSMVKFRPPYYNVENSKTSLHALKEEFKDVIHKKDGRFMLKYTFGSVMLPIYGRLNTTECRLIVQEPDRTHYYDIMEHEQVMCAFNNEMRGPNDWDREAYKLVAQFFREQMPPKTVFVDYRAHRGHGPRCAADAII